jgi:anti-sigma factor RsiW
MIDCPNAEIRDRLPDFVHGQLGAAARAEVAAHTAICAACAAELALLRELRATLRAAPSVDVTRIVSALPAAPARVAPRGPALARPTWRRFDWRVAAAVVAMAAAGGSVVVLSRYGGTGDGAPVPGSQVAQTPDSGGVAATTDVGTLRVATVSIDADLADATAGEIEELLAELETFDGLPAGEPESTLPTPGDEGVDR